MIFSMTGILMDCEADGHHQWQYRIWSYLSIPAKKITIQNAFLDLIIYVAKQW